MTLGKKRLTLSLACSVALAIFGASATAGPAHRTEQRAALAAAQSIGADGDIRNLSGTEAYAARSVEDRRWRHRRQPAAKATKSYANSACGRFTGRSLVAEARKYLGTNPTGRSSLWCGAFMDMVLKRTGHAGGGNLALAYLHYGTRVGGPQIGAIAVMGRHGGGHVGVVSGVDANGNPIIVSGNHNHTVAEAAYPRSRISAYVMPSN